MHGELLDSPAPRPPLRLRVAQAVARWAEPLAPTRLRAGSWLVVGVAVALVLPSVRTGYAADDHVLRVALAGDGALAAVLPSRPGALFTFVPDGARAHGPLMDLGIIPWWTRSDLHIAFFRPLASLTHGLDHWLAPDTPWVAHAQNLAWFAFALLAVAGLYRRVLGPTGLALLATGLYALDDAHGQPVGWICNRNAFMALGFGALTLIAHDRHRREGRLVFAPLAVVALAASLLSGEAGVGTLALLVAYAAWLDDGSLRARAMSLAPAVLTVVLWRAASIALGYGVHGSGLYIDPVHAPLRFAAAAVERIPPLLMGQLALPPADTALAYGYLQPWLGPAVIAVSALLLAGFAWLCLPLLREDRRARFFATVALLAVIPCCAGIPQDRMLWFVGVGAMGLLALLFARAAALYLARAADPPGASARAPSRVRALFAVVVALALVHLVLAPPMLLARSGAMGRFAAALDRAVHAVEGVDDLPQRTVVFVNPPSEMPVVYVLPHLAADRRPLPEALRWLVVTTDGVEADRVDPRTLELRVPGGFLRHAGDQFFYDPADGMRPGERVALRGLTVTVLETDPDGFPTAVRFTFDASLDDPRYVFRAWTDDGFVPFAPPPVGGSVELAPTDPFLSLTPPRSPSAAPAAQAPGSP